MYEYYVYSVKGRHIYIHVYMSTVSSELSENEEDSSALMSQGGATGPPNLDPAL